LTTDLKLSIANAITKLSYFLLLLALAGNLWLQNQPVVIYFLVLLPLVIFIPGILTDNNRTLIWMGFVLLLYFAAAVYGVAKPQPLFLDIAELVLTIVLFCASMFYVRIKQVNK
jgi:uncharacterized membrane protein